jgi:putative membrane protein
MQLASLVLVALVAFEHALFLAMEMFLWTTPRIRATFGTTAEFAEASKTLAANQGLYNGFLAAGLVWGLLYPDPAVSRNILIFFTACVIVAGVFGGFTVKRSILVVQVVPALLALIAVLVR